MLIKDIKIEKIILPLKSRHGICKWEGENLSKEVENCLRLYPQDNNTDGFFIAKIKKISEKEKDEKYTKNIQNILLNTL